MIAASDEGGGPASVPSGCFADLSLPCVNRATLLPLHGVRLPFVESDSDRRHVVEYQNIYTRYGSPLAGVIGAHLRRFRAQRPRAKARGFCIVCALAAACGRSAPVTSTDAQSLPAGPDNDAQTSALGTSNDAQLSEAATIRDAEGPADDSQIDVAASDDAASPLEAGPAMCPPGFTTQLPPGQSTGYMSARQSRSFHLVLPPPSFAGPRPLLFVFHGTGLSGVRAIQIYGLQDWADAGFIIVAPDTNNNGTFWPVWDFVDPPPNAPPHTNADLALFDDLIQCVAGHYAVDANRIYVGGHSAGGSMTHYVLARRSSLLAGGIGASGAITLALPKPPLPTSPMAVIVTWGGDNDIWSGSIGGVSVTNANFGEESALASQYWHSQPGTFQIQCKGTNLGHNWLNQLNGWMRNELVNHPKGFANVPAPALPPLPAGAQASCSEDTATYVSAVHVTCPASATPGCQAYCQLWGHCVAENGTIGGPLAQQLGDVGFTGVAPYCPGCISACESDSRGGGPDTAFLNCIAGAAPNTMCGPGFVGGQPGLNAIGGCCASAAGSQVCKRFCSALAQNTLFARSVTGCP